MGGWIFWGCSPFVKKIQRDSQEYKAEARKRFKWFANHGIDDQPDINRDKEKGGNGVTGGFIAWFCRGNAFSESKYAGGGDRKKDGLGKHDVRDQILEGSPE